MSLRVTDGIRHLAENGLNLWAVFACSSLPPTIAEPMRDAGIAVGDYSRLVVVGHGGRGMWEALGRFGFRTDDPVDFFSTHLVQQMIGDYLDDARSQIIYPGRGPGVPLIRLGEAAGWSRPSPIGPGIHPEYGLWFAYRVAFLTDAPLLETEKPSPLRPCDTCEGRPCLGGCPAGAVRWPVDFQLQPCLGYRLAHESPCADRCLARLACPVAPQHRYSDEQIGYHYRHSLPSLRRYWMSTGNLGNPQSG